MDTPSDHSRFGRFRVTTQKQEDASHLPENALGAAFVVSNAEETKQDGLVAAKEYINHNHDHPHGQDCGCPKCVDLAQGDTENAHAKGVNSTHIQGMHSVEFDEL